MKTLQTTIMTAMFSVASSLPALAVDTTRTYSSGLLVGIFLAFCALIIVVQLVPTIMLLAGFLKGLLRGSDKKAEVRHAGRTGH